MYNLEPQTHIHVIQPESVEVIFTAMKALRDRQIVIVDLSLLKTKQAQQVVNYLTKCAIEINGQGNWIDHRTFIFTPGNSAIQYR